MLVMQGVPYDYSTWVFYVNHCGAAPVAGPFIGGAVANANAYVNAAFTLKATA
jgi:hypothetical protein